MNVVIVQTEDINKRLDFFKDYTFIIVHTVDRLIDVIHSYNFDYDYIYCMFPFKYLDFMLDKFVIVEVSYIYSNTHVSLLPAFVICRISCDK